MMRRTSNVLASHRSCSWLVVPVTIMSFVALFVMNVHAQLPSTQLSSIFPPGGKFGTTFDVRVSGADQIDVTKLEFSHSGIKATQKTSKTNEFLPEQPVAGQYSITIDGTVPAGIYEARVVGRYGVSNPRAFTVGLHEEVNEAGGNNTKEAAFAIGVGQTVNGWVDANKIDYFKLPLKEGQRVLLDCAAQRIDSRLDATLIAYDPNGREVARSRDYIGKDPFLDLTAQVGGDYVIALYDFVYRGGADSFYRLTVHMDAHVDFVFPPSGVPGSNDSYVIYGRNLPNGKPSEVSIDGTKLDELSVNVPVPADAKATQSLAVAERVAPQRSVLDSFSYQFNSASPTTLYFADAAVTKEQEPNDSAENVQQVAAPCEFVGQFFPVGDLDVVQFEAKKGQVFVIDLISHRMDLNTDPYLIVQRVTKNDKGEEVVANIKTVDDPSDRNGRIGTKYDTSTDDPSYQLTADQDAVYRITVRDQNRSIVPDPRNIYRLAIREPKPDFRVIAVAERIQAPVNANAVLAGTTSVRRGGTTLFDVRIERRDGFSGEIEVSAEGLPAGVTSRPTLIHGTQNSGVLVFQAAEDAAPWSGSIQVVGKATIDDQSVTRYARGGVVVWETGNRTQQPPNYRASRNIAFAIIDQDPSKALVELGDDKIWETSRGGKLEIPIKVTRREDFKSDVTLVANNAPKEFKPGNVAVKADTSDGKLALDLKNKATKPGVYTFYVRADTKIKHVRDPGAITKAQEEQKVIDAAVAKATEDLKAANAAKATMAKAAGDAAAAAKQSAAAKTAAEQGLQKAVAAAKQSDEKLAAAKKAVADSESDEQLAKAVADAEAAKAATDKAKADAEAKLKADTQAATAAQTKAVEAEAVKAAADKTAADTDALLKRAQAAKKAADKKVADTQKANNAADKNVAFISTPIRLRVVDSPLKLTATAESVAVKQEAAAELSLKLERMYGFADATSVAIELPKGVAGISIAAVTIAKDAADGKFEIKAAKDATVGEHAATIRAKAKFNGVDVEATLPVVIKIEAKS